MPTIVDGILVKTNEIHFLPEEHKFIVRMYGEDVEGKPASVDKEYDDKVLKSSFYSFHLELNRLYQAVDCKFLSFDALQKFNETVALYFEFLEKHDKELGRIFLELNLVLTKLAIRTRQLELENKLESLEKELSDGQSS